MGDVSSLGVEAKQFLEWVIIVEVEVLQQQVLPSVFHS